MQVNGLAAAGAEVRQLAADLDGNAGRVSLRASADGVRIPGPRPDLLAGAPLQLTADARLDDPARPVTFDLSHPLLAAKGQARTAGTQEVTADINLPSLAPLAAIGGIDLQGSTALRVHAVVQDTTKVDADGTLSITGGLAPLPGLVGEGATLGVSAELRGQDLSISRLDLAGRTLRLGVKGAWASGKLQADLTAALSDLAVIAPTLSGAIQADAHVQGAPDDLTVSGQLAGEVGAPGVKRGPVKVEVALQGLPSAPSGTIRAQGTLADAPLELAVNAKRGADGTLDATIDRADWRSLHAEGALRLPAGQTHAARASAAPHGPAGRPQAVHRPGTRGEHKRHRGAGAIRRSPAGRGEGRRHPRHPCGERDRYGAHRRSARIARGDRQRSLSGIQAGSVAGSAKLDVSGPQDALAIRTTAALNLSGTPAQIAAAATLNVPAKRVQVASLQVEAKGETARLLAPATIAFGGPVTVDRLRLGLRQAVLDVSGELSPRLDATATLARPPTWPPSPRPTWPWTAASASMPN